MSRRRTAASAVRHEENMLDDEVTNVLADSPSDVEVISKIRGRNGTVGRKRGRGPSRNPCLNRNAMMARENRQRKKEYVSMIETKLLNLQQENRDLKLRIQGQATENKKLRSEVSHLRAVMTNNTVITKLLKAINDSITADKNVLSTALTERLNTRDTNVIEKRIAHATEKILPSEVTSNEENTDPLFSHADDIISKLTHLTGDNEDDVTPMKRSRLSDIGVQPFTEHAYAWSKDDVSLDVLSNQLTNNDYVKEENYQDLGESVLPTVNDSDLNQLSSFNIDSLFDTLDDASNSLDQGNAESNICNNECVTSSLLPSSGICIHVNGKKVSLDFCVECHARASVMGENEHLE